MVLHLSIQDYQFAYEVYGLAVQYVCWSCQDYQLPFNTALCASLGQGASAWWGQGMMHVRLICMSSTVRGRKNIDNYCKFTQLYEEEDGF